MTEWTVICTINRDWDLIVVAVFPGDTRGLFKRLAPGYYRFVLEAQTEDEAGDLALDRLRYIANNGGQKND